MNRLSHGKSHKIYDLKRLKWWWTRWMNESSKTFQNYFYARKSYVRTYEWWWHFISDFGWSYWPFHMKGYLPFFNLFKSTSDNDSPIMKMAMFFSIRRAIWANGETNEEFSCEGRRCSLWTKRNCFQFKFNSHQLMTVW